MSLLHVTSRNNHVNSSSQPQHSVTSYRGLLQGRGMSKRERENSRNLTVLSRAYQVTSDPGGHLFNCLQYLKHNHFAPPKKVGD